MQKSKWTFVFFMLTFLLSAFLSSVFTLNAYADTDKKNEKQTPDSLKLYSLKDFYGKNNDAIVSFNNVDRALKIYKSKNNKLEVEASQEIPQFLSNLCLYENNGKKQIVVALGWGRGDLDAPIKIFLTDGKFDNATLIYEVESKRSEVSFLKQVGEDIYISYFNSKYNSVFGKLMQVAEDKWDFIEIAKVRLGIAVDIDKDSKSVVFARPYKDEEKKLSEVILLNKDKKIIELPSFRGASSVAFANIDNDKEKEILIGDGWHQNYAAMAEPRFSYIKINPKTKKYELSLISNIKGQPSIDKIIPFNANNKDYILTVGEKFINLYEPKNNWKQKTILEKTGDAFQTLDAVFVLLDGKPRIATFDKKLEIKTF